MKNNKYNVSAGHMVKCSCGKVFIPTVQWVYKASSSCEYFCSYKCWRKAGYGETPLYKQGGKRGE